ncbi:ferredoxin [Alkalitalea saponilacus]|uniref:Uncharacterized protein n=1 Tax=Alkalitalea saponilacus TaxID=889453 RepID=A0A1T5GAQ5_9BACT|nr:ferredoxin [Alkalitalea saponilacus]SKC05387.1 hypothetical protein SAMN03080601_01792 [Alkalitalea saponilacus]
MSDQKCKGDCICVHCNIKYIHKPGIPCREKVCEKCHKPLMREGSFHHQLYLKKLQDSGNNLNL